MYKGFKTYRHYVNARLHTYSRGITGDDTALRENVAGILKERGVEGNSVKLLTDQEAELLLKEFGRMLQKIYKNQEVIDKIIGNERMMTVNQRACILKLARYKFSWQPPATFSFILEVFPKYREKLTPWEIKNSKLRKLYSLITCEDADLIIKKLDKIQERNFSKKADKKNEQI